MEHPPVANPPVTQSPLLGDNITAVFSFGTPPAANGTTKTEKFGMVSPEGGQFMYTYLSENKSTTMPTGPERTLSEDLDNYFVCRLVIAMKAQDVRSDAYQIRIHSLGH